ncbi:glycosyl transferase CpsE [Ruminococcus sp. CAG:60]|nr:glycosyl transferase CpsE [Ruminococcus sp. CAG:60]
MYKKENNSWLKHIDFVILDILCLQLAFILAYEIRVAKGIPYLNPLYENMAFVLVIFQLLVSFFGESFSGVLRRGFLIEMKCMIEHEICVMLLAVLYLFMSQQGVMYSRGAFTIMCTLYFFIAYVARIGWKKVIRSRKFAEGEKRSILIITTDAEAANVVKALRGDSYGTYHLAGVALLDKNKTGSMIQSVPVVAGADDVTAYIHKNWVDEVFFALPEHVDIPKKIMKDCNLMGVVTHVQLAALNELGKNQVVEEIAGYMVLSSSINIVSSWQLLVKRLMDIAGGLVGCIFTGIIYIFIAPIMKVKSPGPVFFSQVRMGKNGKPFKIYKFRSMYMDAEERKKELMEKNNIKDGLMFKMDDDPRIIKGIGHFIRKTSLDEFPQFWNILKGDMSLVGTRPPTMDEWDKYELHHRRRLAIKPGLTGMWQVSGRSEITDFEEVVELDTKYIEQWSIGLDIKILFKTVTVVFTGSGAK